MQLAWSPTSDLNVLGVLVSQQHDWMCRVPPQGYLAKAEDPEAVLRGKSRHAQG